MRPQVIACVLAVAITACSRADTSGVPPSTTAEGAWFSEAARERGLDFVHVNGMSGQRYIAEIMAPGVALFDYDADGDLDAYAVQGQLLRNSSGPEPLESQDRLYRNELSLNANGTRTLRFTDVTQQAGLVPRSYGMGVAAGDFDNDGHVDLYLTRLGADALLRNNGDGTFTDVFARAGLVDPGWSVAASFFDYDRDGWLDLFVSSYIRYNVATDTKCVGPTGVHDYCNPQNYAAAPGRLFRNARNGRFEDVTAPSGVAREYGPALGTVAFDANDDGWLDLYVANDGSENQLWLNRRNGTFENGALSAGVAISGDGRAEGSMGVDAGDFDNDGDDDLLITNLTGEGTTVYANQGGGLFNDVATASGVRSRTLPGTGFGTAWVDVDNDGWLDIVAVNGAIQMLQSLVEAGDPLALQQRRQLLRNRGDGRFEDATTAAGAAFGSADVGRGAAFGDVDNDGDIDVLVGNNNGPLRLLINERGHGARWLGVRVAGANGRDMIGTRVGVVRSDGATRWRRARSDGSYASANDPRVLFGLSDSGGMTRLRVQWPGGRLEEWPFTESNRWVTIVEGRGLQ